MQYHAVNADWNLVDDNGISKEYLKKVKYRNKVLGALRFGRTLHQFHMLYNEMIELNNISEAVICDVVL